MPINLNSTILSSLPDDLQAAQRALYYADSLFETIRVFDGKIPFLDRHLHRLLAGMNALGYVIPEHWQVDFFLTEILKISPPNARVRLSVWRTAGGLYFPENNTPQFLISSEPLESARFQWFEQGVALGLCESVRLPVDAYSGFKTLNAARYVAAAKEARDRGWDDALLLNSAGQVAEATSSNVFWSIGNRVFTAPLTDGCVAGTMRSFLLEKSVLRDCDIQEKSFSPEDLSAADEIFLSNAIRGIVPVRIFAGRTLSIAQSKRYFEGLVEETERLLT